MMPPKIPFNKPFIAGKELFYIAQAVTLGNISGDGFFTQGCGRLLEERFQIPKVLLTPSYRVPHPIVNGALAAIFGCESPLGHRLPFPWGTSLLAVLQRATWS
jgi:hypothetical protein